jgi:hypothetical protein
MSDPSFCEQRKLNQMLNTPLTRYESITAPLNPYINSTYTKYDFDMRRKAEILKYNSNKSSTQTNNLTKKQQFSQIIKGNVVKIPQSQQLSAGLVCSNTTKIYTPTSSSNVPGPVIYLYEDPNVNLYNYTSGGSQGYSLNIKDDLRRWITTIPADLQFENNRSTALFYLQITKNIDQKSYMFDMNIPVGVQINGVVTDASSRTISIHSVNMSIYYNTGLVNKYTNGNTLLGTGLSMNFTGSNIGESFTANQFLGNIGFNNIELYTEYGYVYRFDVTFNMSVSYTNTNELSKVDPSAALTSYYAIGNIVELNTSSNCTITYSSGSTAIKSTFQFNSST